MEVFKVHKKYLEELEKEDKKMGNRMPLYRYITRPDTHPLFAPIFKDLSEKCQWQQEQWRMNQEYSSMIHDQKVAVWEKKNNWFPVPLMTEVSEAQKKNGIYPCDPAIVAIQIWLLVSSQLSRNKARISAVFTEVVVQSFGTSVCLQDRWRI